MKVLAVATMLSLLALTPLAAQDAQSPASHVHRVFDILREGSKIGTDTLDISRQGDVTTVKGKTHIVVKIAFITAYHYDHSETGVWKGSQLVSFSSTTDDNGKSHKIVAKQTGKQLALSVDGEAAREPITVEPANLWNAQISLKPDIFDPADGKRMTVTTEDLGTETLDINGTPQKLQHIRLSGEFARDLWFDTDGLVRMTMLGSDNSKIESHMRQSTATN
jgi:hypothetical protein